MVKVTRPEKEFREVVITLEDQEEVDFMLGLLELDGDKRKDTCENWDENIDVEIWEALKNAVKDY